jgi:hypothetical protein
MSGCALFQSLTTLRVVARYRGLHQLRCRSDILQRGAIAPRKRASSAAPHFFIGDFLL